MNRNQHWWIEKFTSISAFWRHDGNNKRPHALLTKGGHSNGFFNGNLVVEDPLLLDMVSQDLVEKIRHLGYINFRVDRVVGPAMGAIKLAHDVARQMSLQYQTPCRSNYMVKQGEGVNLTWSPDRFSITPGEMIIPVEDTLTTGGSLVGMIDALEFAQAIVAPFVFVIVNRSGMKKLGKRDIIALIDVPMTNWSQSECKLCRDGSEAIHPKVGNGANWKMLTAEYSS